MLTRAEDERLQAEADAFEAEAAAAGCRPSGAVKLEDVRIASGHRLIDFMGGSVAVLVDDSGDVPYIEEIEVRVILLDPDGGGVRFGDMPDGINARRPDQAYATEELATQGLIRWHEAEIAKLR